MISLRNTTSLLLVVILLFSCRHSSKIRNNTQLVEKLFQNKEWYIDKIIRKDEDFFLFREIQSGIKKNDSIVFYNIFRIENSVNFISHREVECMADCYPYSLGKIKFVEKNKVIIYVKEFKQRGLCEKIDKKINKSLGNYIINKISEKEFKLIKEK